MKLRGLELFSDRFTDQGVVWKYWIWSNAAQTAILGTCQLCEVEVFIFSSMVVRTLSGVSRFEGTNEYVETVGVSHSNILCIETDDLIRANVVNSWEYISCPVCQLFKLFIEVLLFRLFGAWTQLPSESMLGIAYWIESVLFDVPYHR